MPCCSLDLSICTSIRDEGVIALAGLPRLSIILLSRWVFKQATVMMPA